MPYAGFFVEAASRDAPVRSRNAKNQVSEVATAVRAVRPDVVVIDPCVTPDVLMRFDGRVWRSHAYGDAPLVERHDVAEWRAASAARVGGLDGERLTRILAESGFRDDLVVMVVATGDTFVPLDQAGWRYDARDGSVTRPRAVNLEAELAAARASGELSPRRLLLRARVDALALLVADDRPWEELTIGFQCRVDRFPDVYNVAFWHHFTNVRPGSAATGERHG
jgi:CMP-N-acetylneuraminate monooxygenase